MKEITLDSVQAFNDHFGAETQHPLVSVINHESEAPIENIRHRYGIYALFIKETKCCHLTYGRTKYDFDARTVTSFAPGQVVDVAPVDTPVKNKWKALAFHPDLLSRTQLARDIVSYEFFGYSCNEALHLSEAEADVLRSVFRIIEQEMVHAIDNHSRRLLVANIELVLRYCQRFYDRQFVTREEINHSVVQSFAAQLDDYIRNQAERMGMPSVALFAQRCNLSPGYFGELVKTETGRTAQEFIANRMMEHAKALLNAPELSVAQVAASLGFDYPQHFIRFFKRHTGLTPTQFRS